MMHAKMDVVEVVIPDVKTYARKPVEDVRVVLVNAQVDVDLVVMVVAMKDVKVADLFRDVTRAVKQIVVLIVLEDVKILVEDVLVVVVLKPLVKKIEQVKVPKVNLKLL
jgi:hypothetical protein